MLQQYALLFVPDSRFSFLIFTLISFFSLSKLDSYFIAASDDFFRDSSDLGGLSLLLNFAAQDWLQNFLCFSEYPNSKLHSKQWVGFKEYEICLFSFCSLLNLANGFSSNCFNWYLVLQEKLQNLFFWFSRSILHSKHVFSMIPFHWFYLVHYVRIERLLKVPNFVCFYHIPQW